MSNILIPQRRIWNRQPQGSVGIDWENPLAVGINGLVLAQGKQVIDVVTGRPLTVNGDVFISNDYRGIGQNPVATKGAYTSNNNPNFYNWLVTDPPVTMMMEYTSYGVGEANNGRISGMLYGFSFYSSYGYQSVVVNVDGTEVRTGGSDLWPKGIPCVAIARLANGVLELFVNGKLVGSKAAVGNIVYSSYNHIQIIGGSGEPGVAGSNSLLAMWRRGLSDDEIQTLSNNPWQIFKKRNKVLYSQPTGFGPIEHVTNGTIGASGADVTGSSSHRPTNVEHETGGAPKGYQASVTGVAERDRYHITAGSPKGYQAAVTGTSTRYRMHPVTGTVVADYTTVTGDAASSSPVGVHECEGIVVASEAIVVGTALNFSKLTSSGAVKGYQSTVTGAAKNVKKHSTNGAPIGRSSQVIGTAARLDPLVDHGTFGEVDGYTSTVTGNAVNQGSLTLTPADIAAIVAALKAEILPVNIVRVNYVDVDGTGADSDPWGPV